MNSSLAAANTGPAPVYEALNVNNDDLGDDLYENEAELHDVSSTVYMEPTA